MDREKLSKMLELTTSSVDAEALTAIRKANQYKVPLTWHEVMGTNPPPPPRREPPRPAPRPIVVVRRPDPTMEEVMNALKDVMSEGLYNFGRGLGGRPRKRR